MTEDVIDVPPTIESNVAKNILYFLNQAETKGTAQAQELIRAAQAIEQFVKDE